MYHCMYVCTCLSTALYMHTEICVCVCVVCARALTMSKHVRALMCAKDGVWDGQRTQMYI